MLYWRNNNRRNVSKIRYIVVTVTPYRSGANVSNDIVVGIGQSIIIRKLLRFCNNYCFNLRHLLIYWSTRRVPCIGPWLTIWHIYIYYIYMCAVISNNCQNDSLTSCSIIYVYCVEKSLNSYILILCSR